jgi:hypothetical protein
MLPPVFALCTYLADPNKAIGYWLKAIAFIFAPSTSEQPLDCFLSFLLIYVAVVYNYVSYSNLMAWTENNSVIISLY